MKRMAIALQDNRFDKVGEQTFQIGDYIHYDFVIQIWDDSGTHVFQARSFRFLPEKGKPGYSTVTLDNGDWRVFTVNAGHRVIQTAQKLDARRSQAISLAMHASWTVLPVSLLLFLVAWWVVTSAIYPLNRLGRELASRNADALEPVSTDGMPQEVSPLVSELNSLLARVSLALQSQHRFVADAAHELRSPLTALKLQIHTLTRARDEKTREQAVDRLVGGVDRASRLVEQLLALARHDPLSQAPQQTAMPLLEPVKLAIADVTPVALSKNIKVMYGKVTRAKIFGNAEDLRVLVRNLIDNAVRYAPESGLVRIDVELEDSSVALTIQDSGPGIPEKDQTRVFDRFFRLPGTSANGSGLGLAIVKVIADRHNATVKLATAAIGGLEVRVIFSLYSGEQHMHHSSGDA
jgi:two-component system OmpR family sensor kinase